MSNAYRNGLRLSPGVLSVEQGFRRGVPRAEVQAWASRPLILEAVQVHEVH